MSANKDFSIEEMEAKYEEVTALYDFAEDLVSTVESQFVADPEQQLNIVEPLINDLSDATDILSEEFILIAESKKYKNKNKASKTRIEASLRKIYVAISEYQSRAKAVSQKAHNALHNIADPIVQKLQRHVEKVLEIFLDFIQISLANLMGKAELEALRVRNTHIAMLMHQQALSQQQ